MQRMLSESTDSAKAYYAQTSRHQQQLRTIEELGYERALRDAADLVGTAIADIAAERQRQIDAEGWTPEHDDDHDTGEMAQAAACYLIHDLFLGTWPWDLVWFKPTDRRRDLVKAGALIIAEIERLDRAAAKVPA
ncbi:hypothetical protein [Mesorhizobium sp.]|uniref:hypothetical protein n=1 Tax=Mesorhizobium sp. TaxID=1871066 RepID=UPI00120EA7EF|nr:hypothetical protein [Mesorhizobium sp.]TIL36198.1 MAG: hypothetical protein E5Y85_00800 [Mesorhizobium sp.]